MPQSIAIDVMGGDVGPSVTIPAAIESLKRHPNLQIILVGNEDTVKTHLLKYPKKERLTFISLSLIIIVV